MTARARPCDERMISGRIRKAEQFDDAAETIRELAADEGEAGDAYGRRRLRSRASARVIRAAARA